MRHPASYISDHLLVYLTLAFIGGISTAARIYLSDAVVSHLSTGLLLALGLLSVLHLLRLRQTVLCALIPLLFTLGLYHGQSALREPLEKEHIYNRIEDKAEAVVIGTLANMPEFDGKTTHVQVISQYLRFPESPELLPTTGKILLHFQGRWPVSLSPGDKLIARAELKRPDSFRVPGIFDYSQHLARKAIWISGFVRSPFFLQKLEETKGILHFLNYLPEKIRTRIGEAIDSSVPLENRGIYRAIVIGDISQVDEATLESFKGSGTMHILSISGLHMTIICALLFTILYWLLNRSERLLFRYPLRKWAMLLCLPVLLGYGLLAGLSAPVFRSVIMSCIVIIAICTDRPKSPSALLACAALIILAVDPLALMTVSFQLSFVATMAILFLYPVLQKIVQRDLTAKSTSIGQAIVKWLVAGILVSTVATLATGPLTLHAFNRFSPGGILANLIVEPLICLWSLPAGFLAIPFMYIEPAASAWLLQAGSVGLSAAVSVANFFSALPFATLWRPSPPLWLMAIFYAALFGCSFRGQPGQWQLVPLVICLTACLGAMLSPVSVFRRLPEKDTLQLSFLDVGQGSASLIEFSSGMTVLIDGGGSASASSSVGERVIAPYLWHKGIEKLDAIIITHPDADHYNGLGFILQRFSPKQLWVRDRMGHDDNFRQLLHLAEESGITVVSAQEGARLGEKDAPEFIDCIANTSSELATSGRRESRTQANTGIIVKVCSQHHCALFPGDIGRAEEHALIQRGYDLKADYLLSPHHGSITSNSPEFLSAVSPEFMIVSAGRGGRGNFPHAHLRDDGAELGITLLTTSQYGTLEAIVGRQVSQVYGYAKVQGNPLRPFEAALVSVRGAK